MADVDHRDAEVVADAQQVGQDPAAALDVHGGERLVEQQDVWRRHQRARQRDALPLAARQIRHPPVEELAHLQHLRHDVQRQPLPGTPSIEDVAADAHVRKQRRLLRHVADMPRVRRQVDPAARVEQHAVPIAIRPLDGRRNPAIASSVVVFPAPDGPNSAVIPPASCSWSSSRNAPCRSVKSRTITRANQTAR